MDRYMESICTKTNKAVGFLWNKDCFEPIVLPTPPEELTQDTNKLTSNANKSTPNDMETTGTKVCKECGRELPLSVFRPNHKSKDGHLNTCKYCMSKKMKKQEDELLEGIVGPEKVSEGLENASERATFTISASCDQDLVDELRARGWEVTCTRTISL